MAQWLYYGGIALMALAAAAAGIGGVLLSRAGKKLRNTLDQEYGPEKQ